MQILRLCLLLFLQTEFCVSGSIYDFILSSIVQYNNTNIITISLRIALN